MSTEAETIAELAVAALRPEIVTATDGRSWLIASNGVTEITDPHGLTKGVPARIKQGVTLQTVDSLVDYTNVFKTDTTALFADIASNAITALVDYHGAGAPQNLDHRATMALPYSEEWSAWKAVNGRMFPQAEFARFLEENAADVADPSGADLLEVCRDLQAVRKADFKRVVRTNGEDESFEYAETTDARTKNGSVDVPTKFRLSIPVYFDGQPVDLSAFLRWKLDDGSLTLGVALHRAEHVRQAEFKRIVLDVAARTERPAVFGKP